MCVCLVFVHGVCVQVCAYICLVYCEYEHASVCVRMLVGSCLATKVFIGNLPAMGRGWVIIK